ncbi:MAG: hypothetical protein HYU67_12555 [Flavobacteriia bacterium]|nr:hypothetical protein [Flavobacteriia bacterium]
MKSVIILSSTLIFIILMVFSCSKEYSCECCLSSNGETTCTTFKIKKRKKEAEAECKSTASLYSYCTFK